jgi:dihydroxyacetone kinase-like protein
MDALTNAGLAGLFQAAAEVMAENAERLGELDSTLGDGDLGLTMSKGFGALPEIAAALDDPVPGKRLAKAGMKLGNVVPSTMGTLMASGFLSGGKALGEVDSVGPVEYAAFLTGFAEGLSKRGKATEGDRTVLDALWPAARAATAVAHAGSALADVATAAAEAAEAGVEATKTMVPKHGKAAVHAAAAAGLPDQGALAGALLIRAWADYLNQPGSLPQ